jgi:hypothetical protein
VLFKTSRLYKYALYEYLLQNRRVFSAVPILAPSSLNCTLEKPTLSEELAETLTAVPAPVMSLVWPCHGTVINRKSVLLVLFDSAKRLLLSA